MQKTLIKLGLYRPRQRMADHTYRESILRRFLNYRCFNREGQQLMMPILELVNHPPHAANWETNTNGSAGFSEYHSEEILVKYSNSDPLQRLMAFGFNCRETMAFRMNVNVNHRGLKVKVHASGGRHWFREPKIKCENNFLKIR